MHAMMLSVTIIRTDETRTNYRYAFKGRMNTDRRVLPRKTLSSSTQGMGSENAEKKHNNESPGQTVNSQC